MFIVILSLSLAQLKTKHHNPCLTLFERIINEVMKILPLSLSFVYRWFTTHSLDLYPSCSPKQVNNNEKYVSLKFKGGDQISEKVRKYILLLLKQEQWWLSVDSHYTNQQMQVIFMIKGWKSENNHNGKITNNRQCLKRPTPSLEE